MRLLVIRAHPRADSFNAALLGAIRQAATEADHELQVIDLCALGFDPVLGGDELAGQGGADLPSDLLSHVQALRWAEALIFLFPTWWSGPPAVLKGWLDRVLRPGVGFHPPENGRFLRPGLSHIRVLGVVTTCGSPWWHWTFILGAPGRKMLLRGLRVCVGPSARRFWLALHDMDTTTQAQRQAFLARVKRQIGGLR